MKKILLLSLFFIGCNQKNAIKECVTIEVQSKNYQKETLLTEIANQIEVIPLQKKENILFGEVSYIKTYKSYYILHDMHQIPSLMVYDNQGNFVSHLFKKGQGPEEYLDIETFDLYNDKLYIYSRMEQSFVVYSFPEMVFEKKIKINKLLSNFFVMKDFFFCISDSNEYKGRVNTFYFNPENNSFSEASLSLKPADIELSTPFSVTKQNEVCYYASQGEISTIYALKTNTITSVFCIDFNENKIPSKYFDNNEALDFEEAFFSPPLKSTWVQNVIKTDDFLSFFYVFANPDTKLLAIYNLQTKKMRVFGNISLQKGKKPLPFPLATHQNSYISVVQREELEEIITKKDNLSPQYAPFFSDNNSEMFIIKYNLKKI